jgi:hypothetical protein
MDTKIMNVKDRVKSILTIDTEARNSDNVLISRLWASQSNAQSACGILLELAAGNLAAPEAITRARRKWQELEPSLRGPAWYIRHCKEEDVKEMLKREFAGEY